MLKNDLQVARAASNHLGAEVNMYGMQFAPSKCKVLSNSGNKIFLHSFFMENVWKVNALMQLGGCISADGKVGSDISLRVSKAPLGFANLGHLWRCKTSGSHCKVESRILQFVQFEKTCACWPLFGYRCPG